MDQTEREKFIARAGNFLAGTTVAACSVQMATTWVLTCGGESVSLVGLCGSIAAGLFLATAWKLRLTDYQMLLAGAVAAVSSWFYASAADSLWSMGVTWSPGSPWVAFLPPAALTCFGTLSLLVWSDSARNSSITTDAERMAGCAAGLLLSLLHGLAPFSMALPVVVLLGITCAVRWRVRHATAEATAEAKAEAHEREQPPAGDWSVWLSIVGAGLLCAASVRLVSTQFLISPTVLLCGTAFSLVWTIVFCSEFGQRILSKRFAVPIGLLLIAAIPLAASETVEANLYLNAVAESALLVSLVRSLQIAALLTIVSCLTTACCTVPSSAKLRIDIRHAAALFVSGLAVAQAISILDVRIVILAGLAAVVMPLLRTVTDRSVREESSPRQSPVAALAALCVAGVSITIFLHGSAQHSLLLFSSHAADGYRQGHPRDLIERSHSMRLLTEHESRVGHVSVWRTSGDRIQIRRNGLPTAEATTNSQTSPQPVADSLTTVLPLVLHSNPTSILILGDDAGAGLRAASAFPLHTIRAVRSDARLTEFVSKAVWQGMDILPQDDERVTVLHGSTVAAIRQPAEHSGWDVIAADSGSMAGIAGQERITQQFFAQAKKRLATDGVFCLRVSADGIGPVPILRAVSGLTDVFDRVLIIRMAPREIALVAGGKALANGGLLVRMQKSHVRRVLSESGWDWSQVAALPVVDTADPVGILQHMEKLPAATTDNGFFAFALPQESIRRGRKAEELRQAFAPHQQRIADLVADATGYQEFARRYTAVIQQTEILGAFPDHPWPYRRSLKLDMQKNPRAPIERVRDGKIVRAGHPLDERRKEYFAKLGEALAQAKTGFVDPLLLRSLDSFTQEYEPLLSFFAHHELVRIHESTSLPGSALELRHRLHTIYFSDPSDLSVRQVTGAMKQILNDPELLATDEQRFDHINSMLQELVRRWERRRGSSHASARRTQRDVDICIQVAGRALRAMEDWGRNLNVSPEDMRLRRRFVNMKLVAPLREYREHVLAHRIRTEPPVVSSDVEAGDDALPILLEPDTLTTN